MSGARIDPDRQLLDAESEVTPLVEAALHRQPMRAEFAAETERRLAAEIVPTVGHQRLKGPLTPLRFWPARAGLAAAIAAALFVGAAILPSRLAPNVDVSAAALMDKVQNASEVVGPGNVRHIVTTYTVTPELKGRASMTLDQWFGNANGRLLTRQTGLLGETTVVDVAGTGWILFPENTVVRINGGGARVPHMTPNRVTMDGIGLDGAQPRVVGRTTVNGRPATTLELTRTLPDLSVEHPRRGQPGYKFEIPPVAIAKPAGARVESPAASQPPPGVPAARPGGPGDTFAVGIGAGGTVLSVPTYGGTSVTTLVVDDQTQMIVQGRAVSRDRSGAVFGTTEWRVTTDVTMSSAQARPDLFVFTPPQGATIQEEPFVRIGKP